MAPVAELTASIRRLERLRADCPGRYRPTRAIVFATVDAVKRDVVAATEQGRSDQALAIIADFEREVGAIITSKLAHAPLAETRRRGQR